MRKVSGNYSRVLKYRIGTLGLIMFVGCFPVELGGF